MSERTGILQLREKSDGCCSSLVKKICVAAITGALCITLVVLILFFLGVFPKKKTEEKKEEEGPLTCYVCSGSKNWPTGNRRKRYLTYHSSNSASDDISAFDDCSNPSEGRTPSRVCDEGEFCAVLHQQVDEIEQIRRECGPGGKWGCNKNVTDGVHETACFCDSSLCYADLSKGR